MDKLLDKYADAIWSAIKNTIKQGINIYMPFTHAYVHQYQPGSFYLSLIPCITGVGTLTPLFYVTQ